MFFLSKLWIQTVCITFIGGLAVGVGTPLPAQETPQSSKLELLEETLETYRQTEGVQATFQQRVEIPVLDKQKESQGIWRFRNQGQWSLTFQPPPNDRIVADGQYIWIYHPSSHPGQLVRQSLRKRLPDSGQASPQQWLEQVLGGGYQLIDVHTKTEQDREIRFRFRATSENHLSPKVILQIDPSRKLLTFVRWHEYTGTKRQLRFLNIQTDVSFPEDQFKFEPPEDVDIFRAGERKNSGTDPGL